MSANNHIIFDAVRPMLDTHGFNKPGRVEALNHACLRFSEAERGIARGPGLAGAAAPVVELVRPEALSWADLITRITNTNAPALTDDDFEWAADELGNGVTDRHIRASKTVEAPRGAFDDTGKPSILYERHVFARNTSPKNRFDASHPSISGGAYGPGGYGAFSAQYAKLEQAYALDPVAALEACSWGAFQVLGENAVSLGYASALDMVLQLAASEREHLESYVRFIKTNGLADELGRCRAGAPETCVPFVSAYNGSAWRRFNYAAKFAEALR